MERPGVLCSAGSGRQHDQRRYPQRGQGGRPPPALVLDPGDHDLPVVGGGLGADDHLVPAEDGQIVVARIEDEATVKRLRRRNGQIWLMPENDNYSPIDGTNAEIIGIVKAVVREY